MQENPIDTCSPERNGHEAKYIILSRLQTHKTEKSFLLCNIAFFPVKLKFLLITTKELSNFTEIFEQDRVSLYCGTV